MLTQIDKAHVLAGRFGRADGGEFAPGGVPIGRIAEEHGTPFYLYHGEMIVERVRRVRDALGGDVEVTYSVKANPNLAGSITTNISLQESGSVSGVNISNRSWGGAGASEAEACIRNRIRSWRFPSGSAGTYAFSFSFTR